jgi:hypothetical protein
MSTARNPGDIPGLDPASAPARAPRHALGLPAGSVRALLSFMVLGLLWLIVWKWPGPELPLEYVYLQYLMILILAHYFASHGSTIGARHLGDKQPLGLPRGSVRALLLLGFVGLVVWLFYTGHSFVSPAGASLILPLILLCAFFLGYLAHRVVRAASRNGQLPYWFQDVEAWVALLGMIGLVALLLLHIFVNFNLPEEMKLDLSQLEMIVAAVVGFYFGARS